MKKSNRILRICALLGLLWAGCWGARGMDAIKITSGLGFGNFDSLYVNHSLTVGGGFDPSLNYYSLFFIVQRRVEPGGTPNGGGYNIDYVIGFSVLSGVICDGGSNPKSTFEGDPQGNVLASYDSGADLWSFSTDGRLYQAIGGTNYVVGSVSAISDNFTVAGIESDDTSILKAVTLDIPAEVSFGLASDCETCARGHCQPGTVLSAQLGSVDVTFSLGRDEYGDFENRLGIKSEMPHRYLAAPVSLFSKVGPNTIVLTNSSGLRQVKGTSVLADIVVSNAHRYDIHFYQTNNVLGVGGNGFYEVTNTPFRSITVENPDGASSSNRLHISEIQGTTTNLTSYAWDGTNTWSLDLPGGLRAESLSHAWNSSRTERVETFTIQETNGLAVFQEQKTYRSFGWGEELVEHVLDPTGAQLTNSWQYYTNSAEPGRYSQLKERTWPGGYWERYDYDSSFRETNRVAAFLNAASGSAASECRETITTYSNANPRVVVVEKLLGTEIARTYIEYDTAEERVIRCQTPGAVPTAADNLITITKRYGSGSPFVGQLKSVKQPDGTMTFYDYSIVDGQKTTVITTGVPNGGGTAIEEGTQRTTIVGALGEMISMTVSNITGGTPGILISRETYSYPSGDEFKLSPRTLFLDGTSNQVNYGCCTLDSTVARDGTEMVYGYDALKRQTSTTANGLTTLNVLDAAGNVLRTVRIGTNSSQIVQSHAVYDLAGRQQYLTNAVGEVTVFTQSYDGDGQLCRTNVYADESQEITIYYRDGALKERSGSATHPARFEYGVAGGEAFTKEIKLNTNGTDTSQWTTNFHDAVGRHYKTVYAAAGAPYPTEQRFFNNSGQPSKQVDPDGVTTLYAYNAEGDLEYEALDVDQDGTIDLDGLDRVTRRISDVATVDGVDVQRSRTYSWFTAGEDTPTLINESLVSTDGLRTWNISLGLTNFTETVFSGDGWRYVTNRAADGAIAVSGFHSDQLRFVTRVGAAGTPLQETSYEYDQHGRLELQTDARNGSTSYDYNELDRVVLTITPPPGPGQSAQTNAYLYNAKGQIATNMLADGGIVLREFLPSGELESVVGDRVYPVEYSYDSQGRLLTMTTWTNFSSGAGATTEWEYDGYRGFLTNKLYADTTATGYGYSGGGRLLSRSWARGVTTSYGYTDAGELETVTYSDGTTGVTNTYDRVGRVAQVNYGTNVTAQLYDPAGHLLSETVNGRTVTNTYDNILRRTHLQFRVGEAAQFDQIYGYDDASRLAAAGVATNSVSYTYLTNSSLVGSMVFSQNGQTRMTTTKSHDYLNRLTEISSSTGAVAVARFRYGYNDANQRVAVTNQSDLRWAYGYDDLGQVTSGKRYWSDGTAVAGQQFEYAFDDLGNRQSAASGGDASGSNLRSEAYSVNAVNQYTQRTVPGAVEVMGEASESALVLVNGQTAYRKGAYFHGEVTADNSSASLFLSITNSGYIPGGTNSDIITNVVGHAFLPQSPQAFSYDADGNLTNDGRWTFIWDGENRLIRMESLSITPAESWKALDFTYDFRGRRVSKVVSNWTGSAWALQEERRFVYDDWNLVAELDGAETLVRAYLWGTDLSGSLQGAGGVGGLLAVDDGTNGVHFVSYDGNGNVMLLCAGSDGAVSGTYEYDPFGNPLRISGNVAQRNPFGFSTKYRDAETDLLYYGHRYYNPDTGRWPSRDPIEENGGENLCAFVGNAPTVIVDRNGLDGFPVDRYGRPWLPGTPQLPPRPPRMPSAVDQANEQFNDVLWDWVNGGGGGRHFGPNDPWTQQLAKKPIYDRMREEIKGRAQKACASGSTDQLIEKNLKWDESADDRSMFAPVFDGFNYLFGFGLKTTGSTKGNFHVTSISCCPGEVCFTITVSDDLRLGSATRKKGGSSSFLPDVPSGIIPYTNIDLSIPFESFLVSWTWTECLKFSF